MYLRKDERPQEMANSIDSSDGKHVLADLEIQPFEAFFSKNDFASQTIAKHAFEVESADSLAVLDVLGMLEQNRQIMFNEGKTFFIYEHQSAVHTQKALIANLPIALYESGRILGHEETRKEKECQRAKHMLNEKVEIEPVFLFYKAQKKISQFINLITKLAVPVVEHFDSHQTRHAIYSITDPSFNFILTRWFSKISRFYIADGHHRVRATYLSHKERCRVNHLDTKNASFLSMLVAHDETTLSSYNRLVHHTMNSDEVFIKLNNFCRYKGTASIPHPEKGSFSALIDGVWHLFELRNPSGSQNIDAMLLQNEILEPLFGIHDPSRDQRIEFVNGNEGYKVIESRIQSQSNNAVGFILHPPSIEEIMAVAHSHAFFPPHSTYFENKPICGLIGRIRN
jgi:uncharacterized protein (DUF1015 family)